MVSRCRLANCAPHFRALLTAVPHTCAHFSLLHAMQRTTTHPRDSFTAPPSRSQVLRYFNEVFATAESLPVVGSPATPATPPTPLRFELTPNVKAAVARAKATYGATIGSTDLAAFRTEELNSKLLKSARLSPDGVMQMAFQLAHVLMHGGLLPSTCAPTLLTSSSPPPAAHPPSVDSSAGWTHPAYRSCIPLPPHPPRYESASTAAFKHGRTETIRSATPEAAAFAAAFTDPAASTAARETALRAAVDNHSRITRDALTGKGMDRHLYALAYVASLQGRSHALFDCAAVAKLKHIILSTSTLNSEVTAYRPTARLPSYRPATVLPPGYRPTARLPSYRLATVLPPGYRPTARLPSYRPATPDLAAVLA